MKTFFKPQLGKAFVIVSFIFLARTAILLPQQQKDNAKDTASKYVATQAAVEAIKQWQSRDIEGIIEYCKLENAKKENIDRQDSEKNIYAYIEKKLKNKIDEDLRTIAQNFFVDRAGELFATLKKKYARKIKKSIQINLDNKYWDIFKQSRQLAIGKQVEELSKDIYPDPVKEHQLLKEFEDAFIQGWRERDTGKLKRELRKKIESKKNILQEVKGLKEKILEETIRDIKSQMEIQQKTLKKEPSQDQITRQQLQHAMRKSVIEAINNNKTMQKEINYKMHYKGKTISVSKQINRITYGIFEFVNHEIEKNAKAKEKERFEQFCARVQFNVWTREKIKKDIKESLAIHKKSERSADIIVDSLLPEAGNSVVNKYKSILRAGNKEKKEFVDRLQGYLKEPDVRQRVKERCRTLIGADLENVRDAIAWEQLQAYFPVLANESWEAPKLSKPVHADEIDIMKRIKVDNKPLPTHPEEFFRNKEYKKLRGKMNRGILLDNTEKLIIQRYKNLSMKPSEPGMDN
jgi:hypothetical protein